MGRLAILHMNNYNSNGILRRFFDEKTTVLIVATASTLVVSIVAVNDIVATFVFELCITNTGGPNSINEYRASNRRIPPGIINLIVVSKETRHRHTFNLIFALFQFVRVRLCNS